jgi:hypothetical protein
MSFLDRIKLIRQVTNGQHYDWIGNHGLAVTFFDEKHVRFAIITETRIAKKLLDHPACWAINHLQSFLPADSEEGLEHIHRFLKLSPEFLNGEDHRKRSEITKTIIDRYYQACLQVNPSDLLRDLETWTATHSSYSASDLSKAILSIYFTQAGKIFHQNQNFQFRSSHITEKFGFFSAAPRVSRLMSFNKDISSHLQEAHLEHASEEETFLLLLLRIMGSAPLNSTLISSLNFLLERQQNGHEDSTLPSELRGKLPFARFLPTRFSLRRLTEDIEIDGHEFHANDVVYVYLAEAGGCPIKKVQALPFGFGRHFCPGHKVSELVISTCLNTILSSEALKRCAASQANSENVGAFLSFD